MMLHFSGTFYIIKKIHFDEKFITVCLYNKNYLFTQWHFGI